MSKVELYECLGGTTLAGMPSDQCETTFHSKLSSFMLQLSRHLRRLMYHTRTLDYGVTLTMKKQAAILGSLLISMTASADVGFIKLATVTGTLVDTEVAGICGAYISPGPETELPACKGQFVTFDCNAELSGSSRSVNMMKFDQAVAANALGRAVRLYFTDDKTIDGYCFVEQITLRNNPSQ